ncbi:hypothetical protein Tco_1089255, partial [Tanacetum coccineum]
HRQKKTRKLLVVDLDEDDDDEMASRRSITRWNNNEEILLAETWIEHSQDVNIGKDQHEDVYWNLIMSDFNLRTTAPPRTKNMMMGKWTRMHGACQRFNGIYKHLNRKSGQSDADLNAAEPIDEDNLQELFGLDPRERPDGKQRPKKKQKSDYRRKCDIAEKAYEAKREKEFAIMQCKELEFLMIDPSSLPPAKRAIIEMKQAEIMRKYPNANPNAAPGSQDELDTGHGAVEVGGLGRWWVGLAIYDGGGGVGSGGGAWERYPRVMEWRRDNNPTIFRAIDSVAGAIVPHAMATSQRKRRAYEAYEQFQAMTNQQAEGSGSGSGVKRTRTYIPRDREEAEQRLLEDYFGNDILTLLTTKPNEDNPVNPNVPQVKKPITDNPIAITAGTITGLKSMKTGVANASPIMVPTRVIPARPSKITPSGNNATMVKVFVLDGPWWWCMVVV